MTGIARSSIWKDPDVGEIGPFQRRSEFLSSIACIVASFFASVSLVFGEQRGFQTADLDPANETRCV